MKSFFYFATIANFAVSQPLAHFGTGAPNVNCPQGYTLNGKNCEQTTAVAPQVFCPSGQLQGETCINYAPLQKQCPVGSNPHGKECVYDNLIPAVGLCPDGYVDAGKAGCQVTKKLPVVQFCEVGALDASGECLLVETTPRISKSYCPPGFQDQGKGCAQITEYDCSPPLMEGKGIAPPEMPLPVLPYRQKQRMLGAKKYAVYAPPPMPIPPPSKGAIPLPVPPVAIVAEHLPPTISVLRQTCQRVDFAPALVESYCPPGFTELGKNCVAKKAFPPSQKCANGRSVSDCFEQIMAPRTYHCHQGILLGEQCQTQYQVPLELVCPRGTQLHGEQCISYIQPQISCPNGTTMENGICIGKNFVEPTGLLTIPCQGKECFHGHVKL